MQEALQHLPEYKYSFSAQITSYCILNQKVSRRLILASGARINSFHVVDVVC